MGRARNTLFVAIISLLMTALAFAADSDFHWQGKLGADKVVEIRGISGDIKAAAAMAIRLQWTRTNQARAATR